jgi:mono/diheme cytochrome c family protein
LVKTYEEMIPIKKLAALFSVSVVLCGCVNDSPADLTEPLPEESLTYTEHVKSIIDNNCIVCHGDVQTNGAPMALTTYNAVKDAVQNRGLLDRISRPQGTPGMMPNGGTRLPQSQINLIAAWANQGLQE